MLPSRRQTLTWACLRHLRTRSRRMLVQRTRLSYLQLLQLRLSYLQLLQLRLSYLQLLQLRPSYLQLLQLRLQRTHRTTRMVARAWLRTRSRLTLAPQTRRMQALRSALFFPLSLFSLSLFRPRARALSLSLSLSLSRNPAREAPRRNNHSTVACGLSPYIGLESLRLVWRRRPLLSLSICELQYLSAGIAPEERW
jgi:hypothetical protein